MTPQKKHSKTKEGEKGEKNFVCVDFNVQQGVSVPISACNVRKSLCECVRVRVWAHYVGCQAAAAGKAFLCSTVINK